MALRAADIHEYHAAGDERLTALLVPAITILMGIAVGGSSLAARDAQPELIDPGGGIEGVAG